MSYALDELNLQNRNAQFILVRNWQIQTPSLETDHEYSIKRYNILIKYPEIRAECKFSN